MSINEKRADVKVYSWTKESQKTTSLTKVRGRSCIIENTKSIILTSFALPKVHAIPNSIVSLKFTCPMLKVGA